MKTVSYGLTHPGKKRENNEDAYLLNDMLGLYAVADGVGGREGGEIASRVSLEMFDEVIPDLLGEKDRTPAPGLSFDQDPGPTALRYAATLSNRKLRQTIELNPVLSGMGTTLTVLLLKSRQAFIANIGDSRAYLLRSGKLSQLTEDHSVVAEQIRSGLLTPEEARESPYRHVITRALGIDDEVSADVTLHEIQQNDTFLLCTDGLTEMLDDHEIGRILKESALREAAHKLLDGANKEGGLDNITIVVVKVTER